MKGDERVELLEEHYQLILLLFLWESNYALLPVLDVKNKLLDIDAEGAQEVLPIHGYRSRDKCPKFSRYIIVSLDD